MSQTVQGKDTTWIKSNGGSNAATLQTLDTTAIKSRSLAVGGTAANASQCAEDQGKFWDYQDYLFTHQNGEDQGTFSIINLESFSKKLGFVS